MARIKRRTETYAIPEFNSEGVATILPVEFVWNVLICDDGVVQVSIARFTIIEPTYGEA